MANGRKIALGAAAAAAVIGGKEALELSPMLFQGGRTIERGGAEFVGAGGLGGTRTGEIALSRLDETKVFAREFPQITAAPRAAIAANSNDWSVDHVTSYFTTAEPRILYDFSKLTPPISQTTAEAIIRNELVGAVQAAPNATDSNISFEVLTGKLNIKSSTTFAGMKVTGGEINIYKVSFALAGGVAACSGVISAEFEPCVKIALAKAKSVVADQIKAASDGSEKGD